MCVITGQKNDVTSVLNTEKVRVAIFNFGDMIYGEERKEARRCFGIWEREKIIIESIFEKMRIHSLIAY